VIENGAAVAGHVEIGIAIVVVVTHGNSLAVVTAPPTPAFSVTSVKVPSPLLW
jgi:hypothetical protein